MPYEFNPLIPDGFQKKSDVTPADISRVESEISDLQTTTTDLKQKKVTKFFSANDYLEDNEIAQYQGEDDAVNNLTNGFFYKKNPAFIITQNGDSFSYLTGRKINWFLRDNTLKVSQYYLTTINSDYNDFHFAYDSVRDIEVLFFAETYAKSPALKPAVSQGTLYYPFAIVNNQFDYNNPIQIIGNDYYYQGVIINFTQSSGGVSAILCASMEAPFYRYLWLPVIMRGGTFWYAAFLYETNSNNEFVILGVDNNLSAFDICRDEYEYIVPAIYINVQGYDLTENQIFSAVQTDEIAEATESNAGLMSAADKTFINNISAQNVQNLYINNYEFWGPAVILEDACKELITQIETTQKKSGYQIFEGNFTYNNLYLYRGSAYPNFSMLQYSAFTATNIATGNSYKFGYTGGNWYFNSL